MSVGHHPARPRTTLCLLGCTAQEHVELLLLIPLPRSPIFSSHFKGEIELIESFTFLWVWTQDAYTCKTH